MSKNESQGRVHREHETSLNLSASSIIRRYFSTGYFFAAGGNSEGYDRVTYRVARPASSVRKEFSKHKCYNHRQIAHYQSVRGLCDRFRRSAILHDDISECAFPPKNASDGPAKRLRDRNKLGTMTR